MNFGESKNELFRLKEQQHTTRWNFKFSFCATQCTILFDLADIEREMWERWKRVVCGLRKEKRRMKMRRKSFIFYSQSDDESKLCNLSRAAVSIFIVSHHTRGFNHCWWIVEPATQTLMLSLVTSFGEINRKSLCFDREKMWELFTMLRRSYICFAPSFPDEENR